MKKNAFALKYLILEMIIKCDCIKEVRIKSCYVGREFVVHHRCDGLSECSVSPFEHFSTMYFNITGEDECQSKDTVGKILVEARWVQPRIMYIGW